MTIANGGIRLGVFGNLAIAKEQKDAVKSQVIFVLSPIVSIMPEKHRGNQFQVGQGTR